MNLLKRLFDNPERVRLVGMIVIGAGLLTLLISIHFFWWPWISHMASASYVEGQNWCDYRMFTTIEDNINSIWVRHATTLLAMEKQHLSMPLTPADLKRLTELPGVKDAFYINLTNHTGFQVNNLASLDSLISKLDVRSKKSVGGRSLYWRTLIGGMTRFKHVKDANGEYPLLVRYVGTYYPNRAAEIIGIVMDEDWYIQQLPARLDSLARDNATIAFMSPNAPDTLNPDIDPYACPNGDWKQTIGVTHGKDTLWWYGDRTARNKNFGGQPGYHDETFDIGIVSVTEFLETPKKTAKRVKTFTWIAWTAEANIIILTSLLFYGYYFSRKQSRRNQIALGHLAHSVKTPVARLKLAADILEGGQVSSPGEEQRVIGLIGGECRHLERAVENAALAMEGGKIAIHKEPDDLTALVREAADAWKTSFAQAGIRLVVEGIDKSIQTTFDREKLRLALDNLIDNALRHTYLNLKNLAPGMAVVSVSLRSEGQNILLSVADSGAGIPKADMKNVFKRFSRSGKDPLTGVSGLGLGLALVKEIAEGHGGKVKVEEREGGGARFIVTLLRET